MEHVTTKREVTSTVGVWAYPKHEYDYDKHEQVPTGEWAYELSTSPKIYRKGAVKGCEHEVTLVCPAGIDLVQSAVNTLRAEQDVIRKQKDEQIQELEFAVLQLLQLTYQPENDSNVIDIKDNNGY